MNRFVKLMFVLAIVMGSLVACAPAVEEPKNVQIEDLKVMFVNSKDPASVVTATEPLKTLLIETLAPKGFDIANVTIEVTGTYEAAGEALSSGTAQLAFIPGATYVLYHPDGAELLLVSTRDGLSKDSENPVDWNDKQPTTPTADQVSFYRSLIMAAPTETGKALAAKVNAGEKLTWDDVNAANWCFSNSVSSSAGYLFPTVWMMDNFDGKKLTDLAHATQGGYADILAGMAAGTCDVGVGYADIRRDYEAKWTTDFARPAGIWDEVELIGVTPKIFNDTISYSANNEDMTPEFVTALQEAFVEIAKTEAGAAAIAIYSHKGYVPGVDSDYDVQRAAIEATKAE